MDFKMNLLKHVLSLCLLIVCINPVCSSSACPHQQILYPCTCHHSIFGTHVYCGGDSVINLENIFDWMSNELVEQKKHFKHLTLANSAISELNENTLRDITFEEILIENALNLTKIHRNAFTDTNWFTRSFVLKNCPKFGSDRNNDIFYVLSKFKNLELLNISETNISEIPTNAFKPINGYQNNLINVNISGKSVRRIGDNSFRYLNSLRGLYLFNTSIAYITENSFVFSRASNNKLVISLSNNSLLNSYSYPTNAFSYLSRPTDLHLNPLTYLSEDIFLPFLNANEQNSIRMTGTLFDCNDCRNFWLRKQSGLLSRIVDLKCSNGLIFRHNNNFINCVH